jgi:Glycosyl transferase family 2
MVSVVMSVFNGERFLREAVESILDQRFREFEFLIIDDGSTDFSASILNHYQSVDARVKVYHEGHTGLVKSLNQGCALAQGKYIARMDADDVASKDRLDWQVNFMEFHPEIAVLGGAVEWIDENGKPLETRRYPSEDRAIKGTLDSGCCALWHPTVLLRREVFVWAGGYRSVVADAEDYDLWLRIADRFQFANLEAVVLKYRIHAYQVSVRKRMQQTQSMLAAQVAAKRRKDGLPDPLGEIKEITPEALVAWGISAAEQLDKLVTDSKGWIQNMCLVGEYSAAVNAAQEVLQASLEDIEPYRLANLHLTIAQLLWRDGQFLKSAGSVARAVLARPRIAGRPLKRFFKSFAGSDPRSQSRGDTSTTGW